MKKLLFTTIAFTLIGISCFSQLGQFKIRNDAYIQIGYTGYKALSFGQDPNGKFALEYCSACIPTGFNLWKPWPTAGYGNYLMFFKDDGTIGIGKIGSSSYKLDINGSVRAFSFFNYSDKRLKTNIASIDKASEKMLSLSTYQYFYKDDEVTPAQDSISVNVTKAPNPRYNDNKIHYGLMAQEVKEVFPALVTEDENGYLSLNYIELIPLLLETVKTQNERIKALEEKVK